MLNNVEDFLDAKLKEATDIYRTTGQESPLYKAAKVKSREQLLADAAIYLKAQRAKLVVDNSAKCIHKQSCKQ